MSYAGCPGPSPAILAQFILKICVAAGNRKNALKPPILGVQGHSRSSVCSRALERKLTPNGEFRACVATSPLNRL